MIKKILLIFISAFIFVSCSASIISPGNNGGNSNSGTEGGTEIPDIPLTPIEPPSSMTSYPILDAEAIKYGIDISQDDNIIKEQIEIKLKEYKKNNGSYKLIFVGKPKDSYTYLNSLAMFALEAAAKIRIHEITIDISKIYFYDRKIKPKMFEGLNGAYCTLYFTFPENEIKVIEDYAFICMYSSLREIKIPDSVISIGESVFQQDEALNKVTFGKNLEYIVVSAFSYLGITEAVIPDSVTTIGEGAFANCSMLSSVVIPASVKTIGNKAFANDSSLTTVTYYGTSPNELQNNTVFLSCNELKTLILPNAVNINDPAWQTFLGGKFTNIKNNNK